MGRRVRIRDYSSEGGRKNAERCWSGKGPSAKRSKKFCLNISVAEYEMLSTKALAAGISRTELIVRLVQNYNYEII